MMKMIFKMEGNRKQQVCVMPLLNIFWCVFVLCCASGVSADGNVTMESLTLYQTHEWFGEPTIYFRCAEEKKVYLPDVVKKDHTYLFRGEESWQPLTTLIGQKCKRCGLYEQDTIKMDDTFYETELCPIDFTTSSEDRLVFYKEKEFNATLLCLDCISQTMESNSTNTNTSGDEDDKRATGIILLTIFLVILVLFVLGAIAHSKWQERQRREQQARFVKMFEDGDDYDVKLGLKDDL